MSMIGARPLVKQDTLKVVDILVLIRGRIGQEPVHVEHQRIRDSMLALFTLHRGDVEHKSQQRKVQNGREFAQEKLSGGIFESLTAWAAIPG